MTRLIAAPRVVSTAFGLAMAMTAGIHAAGVAVVASVLAAVAVLAGIRFRSAGTAAVLLATVAIALTDGPPLLAGLAGLSAACYLVLRHTERRLPWPVVAPVMVAALGFTIVGVLPSAFPLDLPLAPLVAPLAVFAVYLLATRPSSLR